jgi:nickel-dependent lactate racemase
MSWRAAANEAGMQVRLAYGRSSLEVEVPDGSLVIEPTDPPALPDELLAFRAAVREPIDAPALRELIGSTDRVVIVTSDITRATPNERLIPWILDELAHVPPEQITVIVGTGSHRATTPEEFVQMFGAETLARVRVIDHDAHDPEQSAFVGTTSRGARAFLNKEYLAADKRIAVGFIEPHFYAGFSGGPKGVMPGVAGIETVTFFHNAQMVGDPGTTWLNLEGSPVQAMSREVCAMAPPDFLVNVTLDRDKRITGFFCGNYLAAHKVGCEFCRTTASRAVAQRFDVVLTTNGGYPLDQNLYQCGKGLTAAARIVKPGGTIVMCAELSDGIPDHGNFKALLRTRNTPRELLEMIETPGFRLYDQWAAQSQALVQVDAEVKFYSSLPDETIRAALLTPVDDPSAAVRDALAAAGNGASCAVLPEGPYVVPFLTMETASTGPGRISR